MKKGFTLIELLAVIAILAIILLIAIPKVISVVENTKIGAFKSNAQLIIKAIELKAATNEGYDATLLTVANMKEELGLDTQNYESLQVEKIGNQYSIVLIGSNAWEKYVVSGTLSNLSVTEKTKIEPFTLTYSFGEPSQKFTVPTTGTYKVELWGESGKGFRLNNNNESGASYVSGNIKLNKNQELCIQINYGGGIGGGYGENGGGATDIRYECDDISTFESLKSRIIVAGGGGSSGYNSYVSYQGGIGGNAGGLIGYDGAAPNYNSPALTTYTGKGATQLVGGNRGTYNTSQTTGTNGIFGFGGNGGNYGWPGGGGGYYGGGTGGYYHQSDYYGGGGGGAGGGSSFISGHIGCDAISETSTSTNVIHTSQANHYSNKVFTNTLMIDGSGYKWTNVKGEQTQMPKPDGTLYALNQGHNGNGFVKLTFIGS